MVERPPTAPDDLAIAEAEPRQLSPGSTSPAPQPLNTATPQQRSSSSAASGSSLPLTPPRSLKSQTSLVDTTTSRHRHSNSQSRQGYLDSLQPPSDEEFLRLARFQEQKQKEHRQRNHELQRKNLETARESMEARTDFMQTKASIEGKGKVGLQSEDAPRSAHRKSLSQIFGHKKSNSASRSRPGSSSKNTLNTTAERGDPSGAKPADGDQDHLQSKAATVIQRSYRGYRVRREMQGLGLDASTRWTHAVRDAQWKELTTPRARGDNLLVPNAEVPEDTRPSTSRSNARQNWAKVATIARRAGGDEDSDHSDTSSSASFTDEEYHQMNPEEKEEARKKRMKALAKRRKHAKMMGLQYFLEMVDVKHRYGSNLRTYHEEWKKSDTKENFFYWLDYGEGKDLDLVSCPRERLDREQVRYLSREERQYYLVKVDLEGRLVWAKNGVRIDTTEEWKDSIHGIVPADDPTPAFAPEVESHTQAKPSASSPPEPHDHDGYDTSSLSSRESELEAATAAKYANPGLDEAKGVKKIRHVSAATIFNKLLRKSVRKNTWIFVADTNFRLYVGIKNSGAFQHSSFLQGSRISSAGLIKVKEGRLSSLSPLSGHYRPPASNFRAFVHSLQDEGVDMSHVSISKSYAVLVGLETYIKTQKKSKEAAHKVAHAGQKVLKPEEARKKEEASWDTSASAARERKVLEEQRKGEEEMRQENKVGIKLLQRLGIKPRTPKGQKNGDGVAGKGGG